MKRNNFVAFRLSDTEYEELKRLTKEAGDKQDFSKYIRKKLFSENLERNQYREILILIRQIRSDIAHALKLYQKDFLPDAAMELKKCSEQLEKMQKEMKEWQ